MSSKKILLCILDGWGESPKSKDNAISAQANFFYHLVKNYPTTFLKASEEAVGLPKGQMGNSEVGHMTIGLGRPILQDLLKITEAFNNKLIQNNVNILNHIRILKKNNGTLHFAGLLSDGGVHSHEDHLIEALRYAMDHRVKICLHAFLDGRDTPPQSALKSIEKINNVVKDYPFFQWATLSGRYYAMDRDCRYERTQKAYDAFCCNNAQVFSDPIEYIQKSYAQGVFDEFIVPAYHESYQGVLTDVDILWMMNFRPDRVRQILKAFLGVEKEGAFFDHPLFSYVIGFSHYFEELKSCSTFYAIFEKENVADSLGEVLSNSGLKQFRIAETEKYAHVTFFLNGGREKEFLNEERCLIPSPKVATYDLKPEMSAEEITDTLLKRMHNYRDDFIVVNYANADMVGHTGDQIATEKAIACIDDCIKKLYEMALKENYILLITADHGNAEKMQDDDGTPFTAHTLSKVPFVVAGMEKGCMLKTGGTLADIAPTILELFHLKKPALMTGNSLIVKH